MPIVTARNHKFEFGKQISIGLQLMTDSSWSVCEPVRRAQEIGLAWRASLLRRAKERTGSNMTGRAGHNARMHTAN